MKKIDEAIDKEEKRQREWDEVEELIMIYKEQFEEGATSEIKLKSEKAALELLQRFSPLFKKYIRLLKGGTINYSDREMKMFVYLFIDDRDLHKELRKRKQNSSDKKSINQKFNFVRQTYGSLQDEEIERDLSVLFLTLARRYKQKGRSFCGYLYNSFKFEVARYIKKYIKDPINISYKISEYKENMNGEIDENINDFYEDNYYENNLGLPNKEWLTGNACSEMFDNLTNLERSIIVKYYLEEWNDRQISIPLGISISTVNQIRRSATSKIAENLGRNEDDVIRRRKTGIKLSLPIN